MGPRAWWPRPQTQEPTPIMMSPSKNPKPKLFQFLINIIYKTSHIFGGFEQLSNSIGWRVMVVQNSAKKWRTQDWKGWSVTASNLTHKFFGTFIKKKKKQISNEDILRLKSPQWELSDKVSHMSIACALIKLLPCKNCVTHEWFWGLRIFFTRKLG